MSKILLVGSSIFEEWKTVHQASPGNIVVNCAVGGTTTEYWLNHLAGVLLRERPDICWYYCGSNDLNQGTASAEIIANTAAARAILYKYCLTAAFVYFGIIKAPQKEGKWDLIEQVNDDVKSGLRDGDRFVDTNAVFLRDGKPVASFFRDDGLHITDVGYAALGDYTNKRLAIAKRKQAVCSQRAHL